MWTTKKLILSAIFGGLACVLYLAVSFPIIAVLGSGMGFIIMPFFTFLLLILFKQILPDFWSASLVGLVASILFVPLPFFGPPGFLPKIIIILAGCITIDVFYFIFKRSLKVTCIISGIGAAIVVSMLMMWFFILFNIPNVEKFLSIGIPIIVFVAIIEGILGGFCGYLIYQQIRNKAFIKQLQN